MRVCLQYPIFYAPSFKHRTAFDPEYDDPATAPHYQTQISSYNFVEPKCELRKKEGELRCYWAVPAGEYPCHFAVHITG